jgi:predicted peptidase
VLARNEELRHLAQEESGSVINVIEPEGYDPGKSYPLFIALHGGGGNNEAFMKTWKSPLMRIEFLTCYIQSPRQVLLYYVLRNLRHLMRRTWGK